MYMYISQGSLILSHPIHRACQTPMIQSSGWHKKCIPPMAKLKKMLGLTLLKSATILKLKFNFNWNSYPGEDLPYKSDRGCYYPLSSGLFKNVVGIHLLTQLSKSPEFEKRVVIKFSKNRLKPNLSVNSQRLA